MAVNTTKNRPALLPGQAIVNTEPNGDVVIRIGGNPAGSTTGKGHPSYASTKGWGQAVVILDHDGNQTPATLRCSLSAK